ncbi:hypothetical protein PHA51_09945 [Rodentibacter pneumotropicus]|nr:hypothetical protein [Rodentibacter pneumotropicus]MDC2826342.1 hypothetical protein [Rodentibacter pneumotropicus]
MITEITRKNIELAYQRLKELNNSLPEKDRENNKKLRFCLSIIENINENLDEWINNCPFSTDIVISYMSERYIRLDGISDEFYLTCGRFLREYILTIERKEERNSWLDGDWCSFKNEAEQFISKENYHRLDYLISGRFDIDVINNYLGNRSFQAFLNYEDKVKEAEEKLNQIDSNIKSTAGKLESFLSEKENKVDFLANKLEKQKTAFNFVGLSQGFESLLSKKEKSKNISFWIMLFLCVLLMAFPIAFLGGRFLNWFSEYNIPWNDISWVQMLPIFGLELVIIYFFRVVLTHYNSVQTQIMQIELRQSLCQFIQSYVDYAKEIKEKDGASLEKFENLIFSSILSTPDKVPSTFDGLEHLSNLIKNMKSGT